MQQAPPLADTLAAASRVVGRVLAGRSLDAALAADETARSPRRPAVQDAAYGTLRDFATPDAIIAALAAGPGPEPAVRALLLCALHELRHGRRAPHVVVDQAVAACARVGAERARGFVNAVLRNYLRRRDALEREAAQTEAGRYGHPEWWIRRVRAAHPERWAAILAAGNGHPPMTLRVNRRRRTVAEYLAALAQQGMAAEQIGPDAVRLAQPCAVESLPGFAAGEVSVQDAGAQHAAHLLEVADGMRVLDACAAPGGKTGHLLERADVRLVAIDRDAERCARIRRNLDRLALDAEIRVADAGAPEAWWDGVPFDRVLLDVPCTASGVVRRHPDIKWLRRESDLAQFAAEQARLLDAVWRVLAPGGKLLYATCSVFREENDDAVAAFLGRQSGALRLLPVGLDDDSRLLPSDDHDGFFYALLGKDADTAR